jgi:hypothetical protein
MSKNGGLQPSQSPIWKGFEQYRGKIKRDRKKDRYYQWDYRHGDIEEYNSQGEHLGSIDGLTGERTKPAEKGRTIDLS